MKSVFGRIVEILGIALTLLAVYEIVAADRTVPALAGSYTLCDGEVVREGETTETRHRRAAAVELFDFLRANADRLVYLDIYLGPTEALGDTAGCPPEPYYRTRATTDIFTGHWPEGAGRAPELVLDAASFRTPQTARLTATSGEEPIRGVRGLVYVASHGDTPGIQDFVLSAAPYTDAVLARRDCTEALLGVEDIFGRARIYLLTCMLG